MAVTRWDPRREFRRGFRGLDRFFVDFDSGRPWTRSMRFERTGNLALDVIDEDDQFIVVASLPGYAPDEVSVSVTDRAVTVTAESKNEGSERREDAYVLRERYYGKRSRSVMLSSEVDAEHAVAEHKDGVLTLTLPKTAVERTKKIPVTTG